MWQRMGSFSQDLAVGDFVDFLDSPTYLNWAKERTEYVERSITLADAVQGWLEEGEGLKLFDTYTSFLLGVIAILEEFIVSDTERIVDAYLDPISKQPVLLFPILEQEDIGGEYRFAGKTTFHPIMQQNYFETLRARAARSS